VVGIGGDGVSLAVDASGQEVVQHLVQRGPVPFLLLALAGP
jgi:hypothetical protein